MKNRRPRATRFFLFLPLFTALLLPASALEVAGPLTLIPASSSANRFNVTITAASLATGTGTTNATGTMNVRIKVNPATGAVSELSLEQGRIFFSNMNIPLRAFIFVTVANTSTSGLEGFAWTAAPPAPVNPANGATDAALQRFTIDKGTVSGVTTSSLIPNVPVGTTFATDFAETPFSGPGEGSGSVTLVEIPAQATPSTRTWKTTVVLPLNVLQDTDLDGTQVTIRMTGTLRSESNLVIPRNDYYAWTIANGLAAPAFDAEARPGEPYGMLWAMGLQPSSSLRNHLPVIAAGAGSPKAVMALPAGGTAGPLIVEVSDLLTADSWAPAPAASVTGGANPIPAGTSGPVSVQLSGLRQFARLRANAP
jgi:hypothetical protein